MPPEVQQSTGRDNVRPQSWLSEGTCKELSLLPDKYLFSVVLSSFFFLTQLFFLLLEGTVMWRAEYTAPRMETGSLAAPLNLGYGIPRKPRTFWVGITHCISGNTAQSHTESTLSMTQGEAEGKELLP